MVTVLPVPVLPVPVPVPEPVPEPVPGTVWCRAARLQIAELGADPAAPPSPEICTFGAPSRALFLRVLKKSPLFNKK